MGTSYTEAEMKEALDKLEETVDLGLLLVLYASDYLGIKPLTIEQIDKIMRFPRQGTTEKHLSELETANLVKRDRYSEGGALKTGYIASPLFKQFMDEYGLGETLKEFMQSKDFHVI